METCQFGLVLLLVMCAALPAESQPPNVMPRYNKFLNQHFDPKMTEIKCTDKIKYEKITDGNTNNCKKTNTFILDNSNLIRAVCNGGATGNRTSGQPFRVVTCNLVSGEKRPYCKYRGHRSVRYITVACDRGWPVHYQEDAVVVG